MDKISLKMDQFKRIQGAILNIGNKHYPIFKGINTVGRNKIAVINIKHLNVSQNQALIILIDEKQQYISDLNSSNGTFLQNTKLTPFKLYELTNKAEIKFGDVEAVYTKILASNTTINLQETDMNEMTQNMTQNFYASNTQLIDNNEGGNYCNLKKSNTDPFNIHEVQTQVVIYPSVLSKTQTEPHSQVVQEYAVEEKIISDIHDAPTQAKYFPKLDTEINIHDAPTQVLDFLNVPNRNMLEESAQITSFEEQKENSEIESTDSNTQILTIEEREVILNRINVGISDPINPEISKKQQQNVNKKKINVIHDSQEPSTSGLGTSFKEYDESFLNASTSTKSNIIEQTIIENNISDNSIDFLDIENIQNQINHKTLTSPNSSQSSTASDIPSNSKKPVLKLPSTQTDDETDIESTQDILKHPIRPIPKLPDTQSDPENTQDIGFRKKPLKPITEDSDTESDVHNTQETLAAELEIKNKETVSTDSDTDCEDVMINKVSATKKTSTGDVFDSDTDIETDKKCDLDDTDCIPPTQDEFALGYKPMKCSQLSTNQSSEESFKLGLTELMNFTETDNGELHKSTDNIANETNVDKIVQKDKEENAISNKDELVKKFVFKKKSVNLDDSLTTLLSTKSNSNKNEKDNIENIDQNDKVQCLQSTQKLDNAIFPQSTQLSSSKETLDDVSLQPTKLVNSKEIDDISVQPIQLLNSKETFDDISLQATQLLNSKEVDDISVQPTQLLSSKETDDGVFLKPNAVLEPTQKIDDDVFFQPTQLLSLKEGDVLLKPNEVLEPTQKIDDDIFQQPTQLMGLKEDVFLKPDALLRSSQVHKDCSNSNTQDIYLAATQIIHVQTDALSKDISMTQEELYGQATQKIENLPDLPLVSTNQQGKEDAYLLPTQQMTDVSADVTETQLELQDLEETIPIPTDSNRPANPLLRELDKTESQESCSESHSSVITKHSNLVTDFTTANDKDDVDKRHSEKMNISMETMSQIEEFLKKPLPPRKSTRHVRSKEESITNSNKSSKAKVESSNHVEDKPETLSQIVAFVNEPVTKHIMKKSQNQDSKERKMGIYDKYISENEISGRLQPPKKEKQFSNESIEDSEEEVEKKDSSREIRSDIDQSFALLESRSSKIRRKVNNDSILKDIKVIVTSHRRTMNIAENDKPEVLEIPLKKSKRTTSNNFSNVNEAKPPAKILRTRKSKLQSTIDDQHADNIPTIVIPTPSVDTTREDPKPESFPENSKTRKLKVTHEQNKTQGRKRGDDFKNNSDVGDSKVTRTRKSKLVSVANDNENPKNTKSTTNMDNKIKNEPTEILLESKNNSTNLRSLSSKNTKKNTNESSDDNLGINNTKHNRTNKRNITDSSEDISDSNTPAKYTRTNRKYSCITSEDTSSNRSSETSISTELTTPKKRKITSITSDDSSNHSPETSKSNEFTTPRKGRNAVKIETIVSSAERSKRKLKPKVVFTMLDSPKLESYIKHLGGSIVDNVDSATVLMTQSVKRSQKLLSAVAQGKPICPPAWINESVKNGGFLDPWDYILVDKEAEKKWEFSLKESLIRAESKKLLSGYSFQLMTNTASDVLKGAIEASGGKCVTKIVNKNLLDKFVIVASSENKTKYTKIKKQHPEITVIEPEAIFDGVLRQELRFSRHVLT